MAKKHIRLPSISRFEAGATAILELPIGATYHHIQFNVVGNGTENMDGSEFGLIRLIANNTTLQEFSGFKRLASLNAHYNRSLDTPKNFILHFKDDVFNDLAAKRATAMGTAGLSTFRVEFIMNGNLPAGARLEATAYIDTIPEPLGTYTKIYQTAINSSVSGVIEYDKLLRNGALYKAIHFYKPDISHIEFEADSNKVIDASKAVMIREQENVRPVPRYPQRAEATVIDFLLEGDSSDLFNTTNMQDLRAKLTFDTAGVCEIVAETIAVFNV